MKYTCTIEIEAPIEKVVELWRDDKYFKEWQDGFQSIELLEGTPEQVGAKSRIILDGQNRIELIETILLANLPIEKIARYEHIHMVNTQASRFETLANNRTLYTSEVEYTKFNGLLIKVMAKLFPGKFKAQSQKWMDQFKSFVENRED